MLKNEKLSIEGFNVEEYLKVFPETATQYLDWKVQQLWFYQVYPEGAIITDEPQPDAFKTPDTWVATTRIYLNRQDRMDNLPAIQRSAKRGPKDNSETEETLDTYTLSIIASIASALSALGFGPAILNNEEKQKLSEELLGIPVTPLAPVPVSGMTPVPAVPVVNNTVPEPTPVAPVAPVAAAHVEEQAPATPAPRRGRPPKAKVEPEVAPTPVAAPVAAVEEPKAPTNNSGFSSLEEARAVVCTYRNFEGTPIGTIWDNRMTDNRYQSFISWCETSDRAPEKCPNEVAALNYIKSLS